MYFQDTDLAQPQPISLRVIVESLAGNMAAEQFLHLTVVAGSEQGCSARRHWRSYEVTFVTVLIIIFTVLLSIIIIFTNRISSSIITNNNNNADYARGVCIE